MDGIDLLSCSDLHTISAAMSAQKEIALTRTKGDTVVTACVKPAPPVWGVPMIVQVRVERKGRTNIKNCATMEEMEHCLKSM